VKAVDLVINRYERTALSYQSSNTLMDSETRAMEIQGKVR
jgi:hypothetical protein